MVYAILKVQGGEMQMTEVQAEQWHQELSPHQSILPFLSQCLDGFYHGQQGRAHDHILHGVEAPARTGYNLDAGDVKGWRLLHFRIKTAR
jgi:hypothetical protein